VVCVDIDEQKIERLRNGQLPIYEPGLEVFFERSLREGRLHFTTSLEEAIAASSIVFLALPTPSDGDSSDDLSYVLKAAGDIGEILSRNHRDRYTIIVDKSTVPVGTAGRVSAVLAEKGLTAGTHFDVVSNPEFLREGVAVDDFMKPERVVIGTE